MSERTRRGATQTLGLLGLAAGLLVLPLSLGARSDYASHLALRAVLENAADPGAALDPQLPGDRLVGAQLAYEDCGDGTVVDLNTGLMWEQKVPGGPAHHGCLSALHAVSTTCDWYEANHDWLDAVNAEEYAGHSDWRVPRIEELKSIADYSQVDDPVVHPAIGPHNAEGRYWAASTIGSLAWTPPPTLTAVTFQYKREQNSRLDTSAGDPFLQPVRAVRTGRCDPPVSFAQRD